MEETKLNSYACLTKAGRKSSKLVLDGSKIVSERNMERTKTFKAFRNKCRKYRKKSQASGKHQYTNPISNDKATSDKTRIGGSTTHVLSEPKTGLGSGLQSRSNPPPELPDFLEQTMNSNKQTNKQTNKQLISPESYYKTSEATISLKVKRKKNSNATVKR